MHFENIAKQDSSLCNDLQWRRDRQTDRWTDGQTVAIAITPQNFIFDRSNNTYIHISVVTGFEKNRDITDYEYFRPSIVSVCTFHADHFGIDGI